MLQKRHQWKPQCPGMLRTADLTLWIGMRAAMMAGTWTWPCTPPAPIAMAGTGARPFWSEGVAAGSPSPPTVTACWEWSAFLAS